MIQTARRARVRAGTLVGAAVLAAVVTGGAASASVSPEGGTKLNLSGVTLNVGDEVGIYEGPLEASGELKGLPFKISWSTFVGGPTVTAALVGGSVDVGEMSDPPPIFAQAADDANKIVGAQEPEDPATESSFAIVVKPSSPIHSVKQLKGKSVSLLNGTILQYIAIRALQKVGLPYTAITPVNVSPPSGATAAFENGSVDALVTSLAGADGLVQSGEGRILVTGAGLSRSLNYVVASEAALQNPQKSAAIGILIQRLAKAQVWVNAHPATYAATYAKYNSIPASVALAVVKKVPLVYVPISKPIKTAQQSEANIFHQEGIVPTTLNTNSEFDTRFNALVTAATGTKAPTS
jgi:sulfonate transport system substrate-binding protein